ncbi:MAG TPA: carboxypeptidase regulatory-like domain-containing protein [Pyrinomonadaceae bacterium]|jgi:hypothetical protein
MNRVISASLVLTALLFGQTVNAQQQPADAPPAAAADAGATRAGTITGRVVLSEGNRPLANVLVIARTPGRAGAAALTATTDEEGNFELRGLPPAAYQLLVAAAGYITEQSQAYTPPAYYRAGDQVTLRMLKGGVITGRVLNANGEPLVLARVRAARVADAEGRPVRDPGLTRDWFTDDRGFYRLYGLEPGSYLVAANTHGGYRASPSKFRATPGQGGDEGPTYYPSASVGGATPVLVRGGEEARGIDIRYRNERTYAVRGVVVAAGNAAPGATTNAPPAGTFVSIRLLDAATGVPVVFASLPARSTGTVFNFDGVPEGVYDLTAQRGFGTEAAAVATPRRLTVRGGDLTGVELSLAPLGSVAGRLVLEDVRAAAGGADRPAVALTETLVSARRDAAPDKATTNARAAQPASEGQPDARGEFVLPNLYEGRYLFDLRLPGESIYVRAIALAAAATPKAATDVARNGLALKAGERVQGLTITLAGGAASVRGRVAAAGEGAALPARLHVYAVPVEAARADDVLRYATAAVQPDGSFAALNLAPGRYWLVARVVETEPAAVVRDAATRLQLRRAAESANALVELQPDQRVADYELRLTSGSN